MAYTSTYTGSQLDEYVTQQQIVNLLYPVGSIYQSTSAINPSEYFGGTWIQLEGRFLLGVGAPGTNSDSTYGSPSAPTTAFTSASGVKGGEESHQLTIDEIPSHTHTTNGMWAGADQTSDYYLVLQGDGNLVWYYYNGSSQTAKWHSNSSGYTGNLYRNWAFGIDGNSGNTGNSQSHNNMPPYKVVYIWKRTG